MLVLWFFSLNKTNIYWKKKHWKIDHLNTDRNHHQLQINFLLLSFGFYGKKFDSVDFGKERRGGKKRTTTYHMIFVVANKKKIIFLKKIFKKITRYNASKMMTIFIFFLLVIWSRISFIFVHSPYWISHGS